MIRVNPKAITKREYLGKAERGCSFALDYLISSSFRYCYFESIGYRNLGTRLAKGTK
mgnify:CR=1 FL=1